MAEIEKQFSRLDEAVNGLKRVKANLKRYKAAVLKTAVEGKLTERWRKEHPNVEPAEKLLERILTERRKKWEHAALGKMKGKGTPSKTDSRKYNGTARLATKTFPKLPNGWVWTQLSNVFDVITDGDHQPPPQTERGMPFLVIGNIRNGKIEFSDTRFVSRKYFEGIDEKRVPRKGDILYTVVGSYGIPVLVDTCREFCVQRHIAVLKPSGLVNTNYLYYALKSSVVFNQATEFATGTAQKTVPLSGLRNIVIPLPPLYEQERIAQKLEWRLSVAEQNEKSIQVDFGRTERLRQSILKRAFLGEL